MLGNLRLRHRNKTYRLRITRPRKYTQHTKRYSLHGNLGQKSIRRGTKGDPIALEAFRITGEQLGKALANLVAITSPEAIFLQGGVANAGEWLFKTTQEQMEANMLYIFKQKIKILRSSLPTNAAIYGASALVWTELNN